MHAFFEIHGQDSLGLVTKDFKAGWNSVILLGHTNPFLNMHVGMGDFFLKIFKLQLNCFPLSDYGSASGTQKCTRESVLVIEGSRMSTPF